MPNIVSTYGTTEAFVKSALMGLGATQEDPNGRFYLDGNMVNVELSQVIAEAVYIEEIFRDGQSVTGKYTTDRAAGAVRVNLDTPLPFSSRTTSYGGRPGTEGNAGVINVNAPILPTNDEFMVYLNQVNDQSLLFPDLSKELLPLDTVSKKISSYAKSVVQDRSASTLAEIISYAFFRAMNDGNNLYPIADLKAENAYAYAVNGLNALLDNGDQAQGAFTYATQGRTLIGRPNFINGAFNRNSGIIMLGGDLSQEMLKNYDLDRRMSDRDYVGTGYKGYAMQFHWQSAPDYIWSLAEKYLGLAAGALKNVNAICVSYEATAMGRVIDLGMKLIDANEVRGVKGQPMNIWGHEGFRKSYLVGDATLTTDYLASLGITDTTRIHPVAPNVANSSNKIAVPIFDAQNNIIGFKEIARGPQPNGGNFQSGVKQVAKPEATPKGKTFTGTLSVALATATTGADIYYTTDGTAPTDKSTKYSAALSLTATTTVQAIAMKDGMMASPVMTETYTLKA